MPVNLTAPDAARLHAVPGVRIGERVRAGFFEHQGRTLVRFAPT